MVGWRRRKREEGAERKVVVDLLVRTKAPFSSIRRLKGTVLSVEGGEELFVEQVRVYATCAEEADNERREERVSCPLMEEAERIREERETYLCYNVTSPIEYEYLKERWGL